MDKNKLLIGTSLLLLWLELALERLWVGEDAFIFFRYVDNFVRGNGLVFNLGEKVEGFTSPLWVFILAFFRYSAGWELRPLALTLGLLFSLAAIGLLLFWDSKASYFLPIGVILLITNSAFRDFATSGFETSVTYLLIIAFGILLKRGLYKKYPLLLGFVLSLLVLNRPESSLLLLICLGIFLFRLLTKKDNYKQVLLFLIGPVLLLGSYFLFRVNYYHSYFPNTFFAKKGGEVYWTQGLNYIKDFVISYPVTCIFLFLFIVTYFFLLKIKVDNNLEGRMLLLTSAVLLIGYVLRSGGDYMHGRSILMAFILLCVFVNDIPSRILVALNLKDPKYFYVGLGILVVVYLITIRQIPYTLRIGKIETNFINDERSHFGVWFPMEQISQYYTMPITYEFGWAERGLYYRQLSTALGIRISVVNPNIGFFGYAAGENVSIYGAVLVDPVLARLPVKKRAKIGHENSPYIEYVLSRKPTFAYTPFKYWNENAHFKWDGAPQAYAIKDDSNDSYIPIFDISNKEFLEKFSSLKGVNIKDQIDLAQRTFLQNLTIESLDNQGFDVAEYIGFLKVHWYPYSSVENKRIFDEAETRLYTNRVPSIYETYFQSQKGIDDNIWQKVQTL